MKQRLGSDINKIKFKNKSPLLSSAFLSSLEKLH